MSSPSKLVFQSSDGKKTVIMKSLYSIIGLLVFALTFALYWQTRTFDFIAYDDPMYVCEQPGVTNGLTAASFKWAFTNIESGSWQPLTFLSYQAEVSMFGVNPGVMHLDNAIVHAINAVLLFMFIATLFSTIRLDANTDRDTCVVQTNDRKVMISYIVAFLGAAFWAWHPLRVESVAWISSRKDVLCVFFYLLGHLAYLQAVLIKGRCLWLRSFTEVCFVAAFLSKPSAIVYPLTLCLLELLVCRDWRNCKSWHYILMLPLCFAVTYYTQEQTGSITHINLLQRVFSSLANLWQYFSMTIAPQSLCIFYKHEYPVPILEIFLGLCFLVICFLFLFYFAKKAWRNREVDFHSFAGVGILWFLISILPVIGLVQLGISKGADRFTYLPSIGFSIILAALFLAGTKVVLSREVRMPFYICLILTFLSLYAIGGYNQITYWKNTLTIFNQAIKVTKENDFAYGSAGLYYVKKLNPKAGFDLFFNSAKLWIIEKEEGNPLIRRPEEVIPNLIVSFAHRNGEVFDVKNGVSVIYKIDVFKYKFDFKDPCNETNLFIQGMYAFSNFSYSLAEDKLLEVLYINPSNYHAWRILGYSREHEGRYSAALYAYKKSFVLYPEKRLAKRIARLEKYGQN